MIQRLIYVWAAIAFLGVIAVALLGAIVWSHGFGSRSEPSDLEANIAMKVHDSSIPSRYEKMNNPLPAEKIDLTEAEKQYSDHCAACHGDDGNGKPKFEGIMSPRPTDLRSEDTQEMSDGELYWVIKNGIRWSGMPAFGSPGDGDDDVWKMVAYVRHLPKLSSGDHGSAADGESH